MKRIGFCTAFGSNHSVAIAGQFLAIALSTCARNHIVEIHEANHEWPAVDQGLDDFDKRYISSLGETSPNQVYDSLICYGYDLKFHHKYRKIFHYFVSEYGGNVSEYDSDNIRNDNEFIIVPSKWVKEMLLNAGHPESSIIIVSCGVSRRYFFSYDESLIVAQRRKIGVSDDDFVFLNLGAMTANKGVPLLLKAFNAVVNAAPNSLLILKDSVHLYGISAYKIVETMLRSGEINSLTISRIRIISGNLLFSELTSLYNIADCYVSPYFAEGFNAPVLEAIACGTPAIVTARGPTDDFVTEETGAKITSHLVTSYLGVNGLFLIPSLDHLISLMQSEMEKPRKFESTFQTCALKLSEDLSYDNIATQFLAIQ